MATSKKEVKVKKSSDIELIAILGGLQLSLPPGLQETIIERDFLLIVKDIQESDASQSMLGNITKDM